MFSTRLRTMQQRPHQLTSVTGCVQRCAVGGFTAAQRWLATAQLLQGRYGGKVIAAQTDKGWLYAFHTPPDAANEAAVSRMPRPYLIVDFSGSMSSYDFADAANEAIIAYTNKFRHAALDADSGIDPVTSPPALEESDHAAAAAAVDSKALVVGHLLAFSERTVVRPLSKATVRADLAAIEKQLRGGTHPETAMAMLPTLIETLPHGSQVAILFLTDGEFNGLRGYRAHWQERGSELRAAALKRNITVRMSLVGLKGDSIQNIRDLCDGFQFAEPEYVTITDRSEIVPSFVRSAKVALARCGAGGADAAVVVPTIDQQNCSTFVVSQDGEHVVVRAAVHVASSVIDASPSHVVLCGGAKLPAGLSTVVYWQWACEHALPLLIDVGNSRQEVVRAAEKLRDDENAEEKATTELLTRSRELARSFVKRIADGKVSLRALTDDHGFVATERWLSMAETASAAYAQTLTDVEHMLTAQKDSKAQHMYRQFLQSGQSSASSRLEARSARTYKTQKSIVTMNESLHQAKIEQSADGMPRLVSPDGTVVDVPTATAELDVKYRCSISGHSWAHVTPRGILCLPMAINWDRIPPCVYWQASRITVTSVGNMEDLVSAEQQGRLAKLHGPRQWGAAAGLAAGSYTAQKATLCLPLRTDPLFATKLPLVIEALSAAVTSVERHQSSTNAHKRGPKHELESDQRGFTPMHVRLYAAAIRSVLLTAQDGTAAALPMEAVETLLMLIYTMRDLVLRFPAHAFPKPIPDLLRTIHAGDTRKMTFRNGWEALAVALMATPLDYEAAAVAAAAHSGDSTDVDSFTRRVWFNACRHCLFSTAQDAHELHTLVPGVTGEDADKYRQLRFDAVTWSLPADNTKPFHVVIPGLDSGDTSAVMALKAATSHAVHCPEPLRKVHSEMAKSPLATALAAALGVLEGLRLEHRAASGGSGKHADLWSMLDATCVLPPDVLRSIARCSAIPSDSIRDVKALTESVGKTVLEALLRSSGQRTPSALYTQSGIERRLNRQNRCGNDARWREQRSYELRFLPAVFTTSQVDALASLFAAVRSGDVHAVDQFQHKLRCIVDAYCCRGLDANAADAKAWGVPTSVETLFRECRRSTTPQHVMRREHGLLRDRVCNPSSPLFLSPLTSEEMTAYLAAVQGTLYKPAVPPPPAWISALHVSMFKSFQALSGQPNGKEEFVNKYLAFVAAVPAVQESLPAFLESCWACWEAEVSGVPATRTIMSSDDVIPPPRRVSRESGFCPVQ
jgi:hypothetical protein